MKSQIRLAAAVATAALASTQVPAASIVYSNDVLGELQPCGCRSNPLGGIARRANLLKRIDDKSLLLLDGGDLLFATDRIPPALEKQTLLQAGYLVDALGQQGQDAAVPGEKDLAMGVAEFEKLAKRAKFKFLAANVQKKNGKALLKASEVFVRERKDGKKIRIGVFGLVGDAIVLSRDLKVTPSLAAAKREVAALKRKSDLIVALTHQGFDADKALAAAVPGIDIIVGGHTQSFLQDPPKIGSTMIYQSSFRNQYVGVIPVNQPFDGQGHNLFGLDAGYDSKPEAPGPSDKLLAEFKKAIDDLNSKEDPTLNFTPTGGERGERSPRFHTFAKCAECHLKQFDFWRKTPHAIALEPLVKEGQAKNKECISCHSVGFGEKEGFESVAALAERRKAPVKRAPEDEFGTPPPNEPEAFPTEELSRYLTSLHDAKNLKSEIKLSPTDTDAAPLSTGLSRIVRSWAPVQCENCHAPGQDHPFAGQYKKDVAKETCLKCHTAERAPEWYSQSTKQPDWEKIAAKRAKIACPAGEVDEEN